MVVNVQMLVIHLSVNVLLVTAENNVRIKVGKHRVFLEPYHWYIGGREYIKHYLILLIIKNLHVILAHV